MTVARAKPTPFRHDACRHGRGPLGRAGVATQRDVRRSGCVCSPLRTHLCVRPVSRTDAFAKGRLEPRTALLDKDGLATVRNTLITEVVHCFSLEHDGHPWQHSAEDGATMSHSLLAGNTGVNLHGVLLRVFAGSCVEQILRPFGRVFLERPAKFNSTVLRLHSCEQRNCKL